MSFLILCFQTGLCEEGKPKRLSCDSSLESSNRESICILSSKGRSMGCFLQTSQKEFSDVCAATGQGVVVNREGWDLENKFYNL